MLASTRINLGVLAVGAVLAMAGCAARAKTPAKPAALKPAAPAAPPAPVTLSTPQTRVELPKPQPIDPAALESAPSTPAETQASKPPVTPPRNVRPAPRTEPVAPPVAPPTESARPQVQEIIPANDFKRLQESAQNRKREVAQILEQLGTRRLSRAQQIAVGNIRNFVKLSDDYEKRNEMRQADAMAERAQLLARNLQHGK